MKPFLKWAGGKRWLVERHEFTVPQYSGRYIEPFLGGGAVFFHLQPMQARLSDSNRRLIETYQAIRSHWRLVVDELERYQSRHCASYYYDERSREYDSPVQRAAQFIYLNRTCWNGLYRENLKGQFNVPIGTKTRVIFPDDDFERVAEILSRAHLSCSDFEEAISQATYGDFLFIDPPYTTAHNFNGFVKYNQNIFRWEDQIRLRDAIIQAVERGCKVLITNAAHESVKNLYIGSGQIEMVSRPSVISGKSSGRKGTKEHLIKIGFDLDG
ncbi:MAG: Dam family site-specific DNA-(adenine-N6)-methyltransferase [Notoacmeibacter sp.]|nr:Dam family site-specific DNA-(adenine-N6)-methyltransferase [Notoacmeibacter sp.]